MRRLVGALVFALVACDAVAPPMGDAGQEIEDAGTMTADSGEAFDARSEPDAGAVDAGMTQVDAGSARDWILANFADAGMKTGTFTTRQHFETPVLVQGADFCCSKYGIDLREQVAPDDRRAAFLDVTIHDLVSPDAFGAGIQTANADGAVMFLKSVHIEPNWPSWVSYSTTNKDGLVLDGSAAIYAEDLTIKNWNADGAIDNKADVSQLVRFKMEGRGNRGIRYWRPGPHYVVESTLENTGGLGEGSIFWFSNCTGAVVNIYASTFNGSPTLPANEVKCDNGSSPTLNYLTVDPRTTGEMHPMFVAP
ncbi:MAG: hypothetical protein ACO1OB_02670 [Archangium sp.]